MMPGLTVTFHGVRGSTPCCSAELCEFGGNTSCVVIEADGMDPIVLDMGTGIRNLGRGWPDDLPFVGTVLLTHMHWDHVMGLPFLAPLHRPGSKVDIYGPPEDDASFADTFGAFMEPPYFPVCCGDLIADVNFHDATNQRFTIPGATADVEALVTSRTVPHVGVTNGYRIEIGGYKVAYISDHQQPLDNPKHVDDHVLELADGVDLLIHDAQYTQAQFEKRANWGHCTMDYACEVAKQAGSSGLVLFHHDPDNDDVTLSEIVADVRRTGEAMGIPEVMAAIEGESVKFG